MPRRWWRRASWRNAFHYGKDQDVMHACTGWFFGRNILQIVKDDSLCTGPGYSALNATPCTLPATHNLLCLCAVGMHLSALVDPGARALTAASTAALIAAFKAGWCSGEIARSRTRSCSMTRMHLAPPPFGPEKATRGFRAHRGPNRTRPYTLQLSPVKRFTALRGGPRAPRAGRGGAEHLGEEGHLPRGRSR